MDHREQFFFGPEEFFQRRYPFVYFQLQRVRRFCLGRLRKVGFFLRRIAKTIVRWLHDGALNVTAANAHLLRKLLSPPHDLRRTRLKVLHVTCSFDLGGTQRQIVNVCSHNDSSRFFHEAIEVFPENNYLYRKGASLQKGRYQGESWGERLLGRAVIATSSRSHQCLQIYKLIRDFQAMRPDIVVGWGHEMAMLTFVAATIARVPHIVFSIRTFNPAYYGNPPISRLLKTSHRRMAPFLSGIMVNSSLLKRDYSEWLGIDEESVFVCSNGIHRSRMSENEYATMRKHLRTRFGLRDKAIVVLNVGRFSREKGQLLLLKAFRKVVQEGSRGPEVHCFFCGDGPTESEAKAYAHENGLSTVHFIGRTNEVPAFLSAADIFVMPSDIEGMPNAMMEAMDVGLPCISTNKSGALDIARDNLEALYVDVGSIEQLAEKLRYLIDSPDERKRIGMAAKGRLEEFCVSGMVSRFNGFLQSIEGIK